ncbi:MAG: FAD-dependent oxidoreductase [Candidatus Magasanikbacteria bacterium]
MKTHTITLLEKRQLTHNVIELHFSKPDGFEFEAGQFVQFFILRDGGFIKRSYSLCSINTDDALHFCIKIEEGGSASEYFSNMSAGNAAKISEPLGRFTCSEEESNLVFIGAGVGITPIFGMIRNIIENEKTKNNLKLFFGVRNSREIFWKKELDQLRCAYENFEYAFCLSGDNSDPECHSGRVTDHLEDAMTESQYYICGSPQMVQDTRKLLLAKGVPKENLYFEMF